MSRIKIASGILTEENRVLLCLRQNTKKYSGYWAFPGGRIKDDEHPMTAIKRELQEELGIHVISLEEPIILYDLQGEHEHHISMITQWDGIPQNMEPKLCSTIHWFPVQAIPEPVIPVCKRLILEKLYPYQIRMAREEEASELTSLIFRSKAYWGYDHNFMRQCMEELTLTARHIQENQTFVIQHQEFMIGVYMLSHISETLVEMEFLFVEPDWIGKGIGSQMVEHAKVVALSIGYKEIEIQGDPYAEPFYTAKGAIKVGEKPSASISGRMLPLLKIHLT